MPGECQRHVESRGQASHTNGWLACALGQTSTMAIRFEAASIKYYGRFLFLSKRWRVERVLPAGVVFHEFFQPRKLDLVSLDL